MCERFTIAGRADLPPGHGYCTAWERATPWNGQIGVLFIAAKQRAPRERYVAQQLAKAESDQRVSA
jgi:hypothetical protein